MSQEVKKLKLKDLVLWTENPRDPILATAKDQEVVDRALGDQSAKWSIWKLAIEMGDNYDFSELPTVVFHGKKPVVYDGNRRVILGKIKHNLVKTDKHQIDVTIIPNIPSEIPCNVCTEEIALKNVLRKHGESGSWKPLERDIFLNKFMKHPKSTFLLIEENTGLISSNPHMNVGFVKSEILKDDILKEMGFEIKDEKLYTVHNEKQARAILADLSKKVENKDISTRRSRGNVIGVLDKKNQQIIDNNIENDPTLSKLNFKSHLTSKYKKGKPRLTKRKTRRDELLFGGKLYLNISSVSDLYRDIEDLYQYYLEYQEKLSESFPGLIRMALRLLCETAANDNGVKLDRYISTHFADAKKKLSTNIKTTLSNQNVTESTLVQLLQTGAHSYASSNNIAQTIAVSIILGEMLKLTHGKTS